MGKTVTCPALETLNQRKKGWSETQPHLGTEDHSLAKQASEFMFRPGIKMNVSPMKVSAQGQRNMQIFKLIFVSMSRLPNPTNPAYTPL